MTTIDRRAILRGIAGLGATAALPDSIRQALARRNRGWINMGWTFIGWRVWAQCRIRDGFMRGAPPWTGCRDRLVETHAVVKSMWIPPPPDSRPVNTQPPMLNVMLLMRHHDNPPQHCICEHHLA